jgi:hypothetical protein
MALIACVQDMIHVKQLIKSMKLKVKLPMEIRVDNKGAKDLVNNWSIGGRTRHVGVRLNFIRELKENGIIEVKWIKSEDNVADISKKNLPANLYKKHVTSLGVGYWNLKKENAPWEGVKDKDKVNSEQFRVN